MDIVPRGSLDVLSIFGARGTGNQYDLYQTRCVGGRAPEVPRALPLPVYSVISAVDTLRTPEYWVPQLP